MLVKRCHVSGCAPYLPLLCEWCSLKKWHVSEKNGKKLRPMRDFFQCIFCSRVWNPTAENTCTLSTSRLIWGDCNVAAFWPSRSLKWWRLKVVPPGSIKLWPVVAQSVALWASSVFFHRRWISSKISSRTKIWKKFPQKITTWHQDRLSSWRLHVCEHEPTPQKGGSCHTNTNKRTGTCPLNTPPDFYEQKGKHSK